MDGPRGEEPQHPKQEAEEVTPRGILNQNMKTIFLLASAFLILFARIPPLEELIQAAASQSSPQAALDLRDAW
jgi:hypothetical protein